MGRLRLACVFGLVAVAALSSCGGRAYVDYEPPAKATGPRPEVDFRATITRQGNELRIDYRLANAGAVPIVAFNGVQRGDSSRSAVDTVYVTARKDGTVEVAKRTFSVPEGVDAAGLEFIVGTVLPPTGAVSERLVVPLPLKPARPYQSALSDPIKLPDPVKRVVFCVGAALVDALPARKQPPPGATPPRSSQYETGLFPQDGRNHLFCSKPYDLAS